MNFKVIGTIQAMVAGTPVAQAIIRAAAVLVALVTIPAVEPVAPAIIPARTMVVVTIPVMGMAQTRVIVRLRTGPLHCMSTRGFAVPATPLEDRNPTSCGRASPIGPVHSAPMAGGNFAI